MKKSLALFGILCLSVLLAQAPAQAQVKLGFKVTGGLAYIGGGDVNTGLQGWSDAFAAIYKSYTPTGGFSPAHLGMDFGGELLLQFNPSLAVGLGVGYLQASRSSSLTFTSGGIDYHDTWSPKISAVPVTLSLHYYLPLSGRIKLSLDAGVGYYFGTCTDAQHLIFIIEFDRTYDSTANGFGVHGGLGLEIPIAPSVSIVVEARGRYASLGNFKGTVHTSSTDQTGNVWMIDLVSPTQTYPVIDIYEDTPDSDYNPRLAKLGLSGFSFAAGFVFRFGSTN